MRFNEEWNERLRPTEKEETCSDCFARVPAGGAVEGTFSQDELDALGQRGLPPGSHAFCSGERLEGCERLAQEAARKVGMLYGAKRKK